ISPGRHQRRHHFEQGWRRARCLHVCTPVRLGPIAGRPAPGVREQSSRPGPLRQQTWRSWPGRAGGAALWLAFTGRGVHLGPGMPPLLALRAVELAETLLREARAGQTSEELAHAQRLARLMEDPRGKELMIALTDQAFRSRRPARIADQLGYLLERYGAPRFMEGWGGAGRRLGAGGGPVPAN